MRKWPNFLIAAVEALLVLLGVYFEPTCIVRGTLRGEAFYGGKPTSWWRRDFEQIVAMDMRIADRREDGLRRRYAAIVLTRRDADWGGRLARRDWQFWEWEPLLIVVEAPPILNDQPASEPVLRELLDDPSWGVRTAARAGLRLPLER